MYTATVFMKSGRKFVFRFLKHAKVSTSGGAITGFSVTPYWFAKYIPFAGRSRMRYIDITQIEAVDF